MKTPQINLNTIKDVLKKLSFLKNNLALLVPILIAVVAVLLFIPTRLLSGKLKNTINEQSVKTATTIDKLIKDVNEAGQAEAMEGYLNAYAAGRQPDREPDEADDDARAAHLQALPGHQRDFAAAVRAGPPGVPGRGGRA